MSQTRRQNSACDQCRNRKVKCNIQPGEANCQHCVNKNYQCTFIAQQETEKKRSVTGRRLVRNSPPNMPIKLPPGYHQYRPPSAEYLAQDSMNGEYAVSNARGQVPLASGSTGPSPYIMGVMDPALQGAGGGAHMAPPLPPHVMSGPVPNPWPPSRAASQSIQDRTRMGPPYNGATQYAYVPRVTPQYQYPYPGLPPPPNAPIQDFLAYLFSPDPSQVGEAAGSTAAQTQEYILARRRLQEPEYRIEFATELIEVYFQVYHPRVPIVNPTRFRAQFREALYGPQKDRNGLSSTSSSFDGPPVKRARAGDESGTVSASSSFDSILSGTASTSTAATASTSASAPATPISASTPSSLRPIHRPLLACLLAWGSKFSDHALLVMDRRQVSREASPLRSNISRLLVDRAREVAEQEKVFRVARPENVVVCLLMEPVQPLQSYPATDPQGIKCLWSNAAIRHLIELGVNHHPANPVPAGQHDGDPDDWGCMVFCWWICVVADALCGLYFKKKPALSQDDYDLKEFKLVTQPAEKPARPDGVPLDPAQERAQAQETAFNIWYSAAHDLAVCARHLASTLWTPIVMKWGIPYDVILEHRTKLEKWRDEHLGIVGANNDLQNIGDYVAAVSACTIDCSYHVMWITLSQAITEYGIREVNAAVDAARASAPAVPTAPVVDGADTVPQPFEALKEIPADVTHMVEVERTIATEAFKSSTRISGLAGVLTSNGYMRLDPNAMHWPIYSAGRLLAELGRQEVFNCIDGLNQNGYAYDESWKHAEELQALYQTSLLQGPRDSEALLHPYLTAEPRATRANAAPNLRKKGAVFEAYKHNVDGPFTVDGLKRKHSPDGTE